jgi:hypothetical protein
MFENQKLSAATICRDSGFFSFAEMLRKGGISYGDAGRIKDEMVRDGMLVWDDQKKLYAWCGK